MFTRISCHAGALVTAVVALTGVVAVRGDPATASPDQDNQFLALLGYKDIPAVENSASLITSANHVCSKLDAGMSVDELVDTMRNNAFNADPIARSYPPGRVAATIDRFISAAVEAYCPANQGKIASIMVARTTGSIEPTHSAGVVVRLASLIGTVPSGDMVLPDPPPVPALPPPVRQQVAPRPQQAPPRPQQPPPPPQQVSPPAAAPGPGGGAGGDGSGGGGTGGNGGGGPIEPPPAQPMPPGYVMLAP
ncbi:DUF732 domain-containing protein [Candidatus Mycobacterium methanotrophicum]|uniref:DUF732 domain-containing protein n=1 Tax=Candidatus Mycobacterium methanotrophicum TaxID=2943498 RepID=A0ABY4QFT6_9MYCO|nr:DUF732 domain-containing protein [Candidatus Mycobacterium methanotrophicum]UQX09349.1 DUF732 domain-containing protein [Candidatus Mycobacterium methanotrophicum]